MNLLNHTLWWQEKPLEAWLEQFKEPTIQQLIKLRRQLSTLKHSKKFQNNSEFLLEPLHLTKLSWSEDSSALVKMLLSLVMVLVMLSLLRSLMLVLLWDLDAVLLSTVLISFWLMMILRPLFKLSSGAEIFSIMFQDSYNSKWLSTFQYFSPFLLEQYLSESHLSTQSNFSGSIWSWIHLLLLLYLLSLQSIQLQRDNHLKEMQPSSQLLSGDKFLVFHYGML